MKNQRLSKIPQTSDPVLRLIRNFIAIEFNGSPVYPKGPTFRNWIVADVLYWIQENGTDEQYKEISKIYNNNIRKGGAFPFARTLHSYCKKHDRVWYDNFDKTYEQILKSNIKASTPAKPKAKE